MTKKLTKVNTSKLSLREKQSFFVYLLSYLIQYAYNQGYELTLGAAYRTPSEAEALATAKKGIKRSLHTERLAIDLNLFKDGKWLKKTSDHRELGAYWEGLDPLCSWGGHFNDGNHYSLEHGGRK